MSAPARSNEIWFAPPSGAAWLYPGKVMHARFKPKTHRFSYKVYNLLIDLDQLQDANNQSAWFSINKFNLLSFFERDHALPLEASLRVQADRLLQEAGLTKPANRILLLCYPRVLGFVFNPISVYFAYDGAGQLIGVIYEVRNTFGERHSYVALVEPGQLSEAGLRQERDKRFYVSPFLDMQQRYFFRLLPPGKTLALRILEKDAEGPILAATFQGRQKPLNTKNLLYAVISVPFLTLKVVFGIGYEALRLFLKGLRPKSRPTPPELASYRD